MEDIQERLVYRTHIYIKTEIRDYNPSNGDIAYPEKLETMEKIAAQIANKNNNWNEIIKNGNDVEETNRNNSLSSGDSPAIINDPSTKTFEFNNLFTKSNHVSPADVHGMWFPTVRRTLICLSKLYRCLEVIESFNK